MANRSSALLGLLAVMLLGELADRAAAANFECPDVELVDQGLFHRDVEGDWEILSGDAEGRAFIKLDQHLLFFYAIDSARTGRVPGSILIKRVYDLAGPWSDEPVNVRMRRNKEREIPASANTYSKYHEETWRRYPDSIRRRFHVTNEPGHRTDAAALRSIFLFDDSLVASELHATKPLIIHYDGFGDQQFKCLDFNLNDRGAPFKSIDMEIYELKPVDDETPPDRVIGIRLYQKEAEPEERGDPTPEGDTSPTG
jgi:hypothetical protein